MTIPVYLILIAAIWIAVGIAAHPDMNTGGYATGILAMLIFPCAIAATLAVLLARAWGWL